MERDPQPLTRRLRRPAWRDPRLGVGVLLMAGSVALGAWTVAAASPTTPVYAARAALSPGQEISTRDLLVVEVNIGGDAGPYLAPGSGEAAGTVLRTIDAGELVPAGAVAATTELDVRPVVLDVAGSLPAGVTRGAVVDLWAAPRATAAVRAEEVPKPTMVAGRLDVARVAESSSIVGGGGTTAVEVLVPGDLLAAVLEARAADGDLVLVPVLTAAGASAGAPDQLTEPGAPTEAGDGTGADVLRDPAGDGR